MAANPKNRLGKQKPTDVWTLREKLALSCGVMRSGDLNWVSVSRSAKQFAEPGRPAEWFSHKNCALQYSELRDNVETPKRKRGEREVLEAPGDIIVRKMTIDRIEELKKTIQEQQHRFKKLKRETELVQSGQADEKLKEIWAEIQKKIAADASKNAAASSAPVTAPVATAASEPVTPEPSKSPSLKAKKASPGLKLNIEEAQLAQKMEFEASTPVASTSDVCTTPLITTPKEEEEEPVVKQERPASPLLCSLLKNQGTLHDALQKQEQRSAKIIEEVQKQEINSSGIHIVKVVDGNSAVIEQHVEQVKVEDKTEEVIETEVVATDDAVIEVKEEIVVDDPEPTIEVKEEVKEEIQGCEDMIQKSEKKEEAVNCREKVLKPSKTAAAAAAAAVAIEISPKWCTVRPSSRRSSSDSVQSNPESNTRRRSNRRISRRLYARTASTNEASPGPPPPVPRQARTPSASAKDKKLKYYEQEAPETPDPDQSFGSRMSGEFEEMAGSPASSVISNETDSGSVKGKARRSRGGKARTGGRKSQRITRIKEEEKKESKTSEAETSEDDDEGSEDPLNSGGIKQALSGLESVPNSPASVTLGSDTEDEKAHRIWKKSILLVWSSAAHHKYANVFRHPVTEDIAPGYKSCVHRPMDLSTIKRNIDMGIIRTTAEFQRDMMLMFSNAIMYNNSDHHVFRMATQMYDDVMVHIEQFVNTELMVQTEPKILRASRRSETVHSDKEDDSKKKKSSSVEQEQLAPGGKAKKRRA